MNRPPEQRDVGTIKLLSEQDGGPERRLKAALLPVICKRPLLLRQSPVESAYMARIEADGQVSVACA